MKSSSGLMEIEKDCTRVVETLVRLAHVGVESATRRGRAAGDIDLCHTGLNSLPRLVLHPRPVTLYYTQTHTRIRTHARTPALQCTRG